MLRGKVVIVAVGVDDAPASQNGTALSFSKVG